MSVSAGKKGLFSLFSGKVNFIMNAEIKILVQGYARYENNELIASPAIVLVRDSGLNVLTDPGANEILLLEALSREKMSLEDIDIIFLTHYHLDHLLNIRLFPGMKIVSGEGMFINDRMIPVRGTVPGTELRIIRTPGHSPEHCSLIVNTNEGIYAIAGDVFWWMDDQEQKTDRKSLLETEDKLADNFSLLLKSRKLLLDAADYIIPGHGKMFKVNK